MSEPARIHGFPASPPRREDPLIDEVRAIRERLSERYGNDPRRLCEALRAAQANFPNPVVSRKRPAQAATAAGSSPPPEVQR